MITASGYTRTTVRGIFNELTSFGVVRKGGRPKAFLFWRIANSLGEATVDEEQVYYSSKLMDLQNILDNLEYRNLRHFILLDFLTQGDFDRFELAHRLNCSPQMINQMGRRLKEDGYVEEYNDCMEEMANNKCAIKLLTLTDLGRSMIREIHSLLARKEDKV